MPFACISDVFVGFVGCFLFWLPHGFWLCGCWDVFCILLVTWLACWLVVMGFFAESLILAQDERWRRA